MEQKNYKENMIQQVKNTIRFYEENIAKKK